MGSVSVTKPLRTGSQWVVPRVFNGSASHSECHPTLSHLLHFSLSDQTKYGKAKGKHGSRNTKYGKKAGKRSTVKDGNTKCKEEEITGSRVEVEVTRNDPGTELSAVRPTP